jgi:serine/threonine-protein kinase HipA
VNGSAPARRGAAFGRLPPMTDPRAAAPYTVARVYLWGQEVGAVAEDRQGTVVFEYAESFRQSGLEISPIHLPLSRRGPVSFPELQRTDSFAGLPGLLADCLPDAFGNAVIRRYFEQRGTPDAAMRPVQKLLYIGNRAMGALEFRPPLEGRTSRDTDEALAIAKLVEEARRVIEGDASVAVPEMMQLGASAGGARAKALILWNRDAGRVKSAFAPRLDGDEHWLIKFDGVSAGAGGHELAREFRPGPYGRIEYAYSRMARAAGIEMTETFLLREREFAHFMTRRFDRDGDARLHMHSLGGLHHADYNIRQVLSYEDYFRTIRLLGMGQPDVDQAYRRMVFNITARNQDDHVKNVAFLMGPDGRWRLAPAFDMTFAYGGTWAMTHQMTARGKDDNFTHDDLLAVGSAFDVARDGAEIIEAVEASLELWEPEARAAGLDAALIVRIEAMFRRF